MYQGTWTAPITSRLLFEAGVSLHPQHQNWRNTPDADPVRAGALLIPRNIAVRGMSSWFSGTVFQDRRADTNAARASLSYITGSHAFKVGMNLTNVAENEYIESVQYQRYIILQGLRSTSSTSTRRRRSSRTTCPPTSGCTRRTSGRWTA